MGSKQKTGGEEGKQQEEEQSSESFSDVWDTKRDMSHHEVDAAMAEENRRKKVGDLPCRPPHW